MRYSPLTLFNGANLGNKLLICNELLLVTRSHFHVHTNLNLSRVISRNGPSRNHRVPDLQAICPGCMIPRDINISRQI